MAKLPRAMPWIEPGMYVECPHCGESECLESDGALDEASLPSEEEAYERCCPKCGKDYIVGPEEE